MTTNKFIMFLVFGFVGCTLISRILEGAFINATDVEILNQLSVFRDVQVLNLFSVPALNLEFFTKGLPHLLTWDYPFFEGTWNLVRYFFYVLSIGVMWGILIIFVGVLSQRFGR